MQLIRFLLWTTNDNFTDDPTIHQMVPTANAHSIVVVSQISHTFFDGFLANTNSCHESMKAVGTPTLLVHSDACFMWKPAINHLFLANPRFSPGIHQVLNSSTPPDFCWLNPPPHWIKGKRHGFHQMFQPIEFFGFNSLPKAHYLNRWWTNPDGRWYRSMWSQICR